MNENINALQAQPKTSGELAASASAALAKATIEAKFSVALHRPRSVMNARARILESCRRPGFAEAARYRIPRGKVNGQQNFITGYTIRFAEVAIQAWGNVDCAATIAYEDDEKRLVRIAVVDLESNTSYTDEVVLNKTVERSFAKEGDTVVGERLNSQGKKVFIIEATEDELLVKVNAAKSKSIRTSGLRLVPQDILDEAWEQCRDTMNAPGKDPAQDLKNLCDGFTKLGVFPVDLEKYIGHPLNTVTEKERVELRELWAAVREGEVSWSEVMKKRDDDTIDMAPPAKPAAAPEPPKAQPAAPKPPKATKAPEPTNIVQPSFPQNPPKQAPAAPAPGTSKERVEKVMDEMDASFDDLVKVFKELGYLGQDEEPIDLDSIKQSTIDVWLRREAQLRSALAAMVKERKGKA